MHYTIYKITNKVNNKIYIGKHKTNNINDGYMGSGTLIQRAISKYDICNFEKVILYDFDNEPDMNNMEVEIVNEEFINRLDTYNIMLGGVGGWEYINENDLNVQIHKQKNYSEAQRKGYEHGIGKINKMLEDDDFREYMSIKRSEIMLKLISEGNYTPPTFKNQKHNEESKRKIGEANSRKQKGSGNSHYGTMWIHNLELKESKRIQKTDEIPEGWLKGRKIKF